MKRVSGNGENITRIERVSRLNVADMADLDAFCSVPRVVGVSTSVVTPGNASSSAFVLVRHGMWSGSRVCASAGASSREHCAIVPVFYRFVMH